MTGAAPLVDAAATARGAAYAIEGRAWKGVYGAFSMPFVETPYLLLHSQVRGDRRRMMWRIRIASRHHDESLSWAPLAGAGLKDDLAHTDRLAS